MICDYILRMKSLYYDSCCNENDKYSNDVPCLTYYDSLYDSASKPSQASLNVRSTFWNQYSMT